MAKKKSGVNKSEEIRKMLKANPEVSAKEVVTALGERGIKVSANQFYFIKGKMQGRKKRRQKAQKVAAQVAAATPSSNIDAVRTIMMVKGWASQLGGMKKLKALVDVLSE